MVAGGLIVEGKVEGRGGGGWGWRQGGAAMGQQV